LTQGYEGKKGTFFNFWPGKGGTLKKVISRKFASTGKRNLRRVSLSSKVVKKGAYLLSLKGR